MSTDRILVLILCVKLIFTYVEAATESNDIDNVNSIRFLREQLEELKSVVNDLKRSNKQYASDIKELKKAKYKCAAKIDILDNIIKRGNNEFSQTETENMPGKTAVIPDAADKEKWYPNLNGSTSKDQYTAAYRNFQETANLERRSVSENLAFQEVNAFYAYMSASENHPGHHQTIIFDVAITNAGHAYSKNSGIFTVPTTGIYVFTWNIASAIHDYSYTELVVNATPRGFIHTCSLNDACGRVTTGIVVVAVNQRDEVFVRTNSVFPIVGGIHSDGDIRSSFAGWQIA
ncbi:uncharacterized protein LOC133198111 [Saccostrea echinata]|uniref:uncharacterized protein LOC133198111 n=1 Tax=Saccostrea echinata TaxID=191078 RepID=UPI002A822C2B|nr:uncharacterized protein LOC133198111 [Saccostrea echinata]